MIDMESAQGTLREAACTRPMQAATAGLDIRPLMRTHAGRWFAAVDRSRADILRWEEWPDAIRSEEDAHVLLQKLESEWTSGRTFSCGIFTEEGAVIGGVTVSNILWDCRCADLGYWVEPRYRGKGVSAWAARYLIDFCFRVLRLQRLALVIRVDNVASQRVAEKLGAQFEGAARSASFTTSGRSTPRSTRSPRTVTRPQGLFPLVTPVVKNLDQAVGFAVRGRLQAP